MSIFNFLANQSLAENATAVKQAPSAPRGVAKNPTDADLRVFRNGSVYPSLALIEKDNLAYLAKGVEGDANGYDVTNSAQFINTQAWAQAVLFISLIDKSAAKVDLFGRTTYAEDGTPSDVATQGAATFGKDLLEQLKVVYGYEIPEGENFVDLKIVEDFNFATPDGIYYLPKPVARGERKGQIELVRREGIKLNVLVPLSVFNAEQGTEIAADSTETPEVTEEKIPEVENQVEGSVEEESIPADMEEFDFSSDN